MSTPRTHPLNAGYLVVGLIFLGLAGSWALRETGVVDFAQVRWLFPATLVAAGLIGIVAMTAKGLSRRDGERDTHTPDSYTQDPFEQDTSVQGPYQHHTYPDPDEGEDR